MSGLAILRAYLRQMSTSVIFNSRHLLVDRQRNERLWSIKTHFMDQAPQGANQWYRAHTDSLLALAAGLGICRVWRMHKLHGSNGSWSFTDSRGERNIDRKRHTIGNQKVDAKHHLGHYFEWKIKRWRCGSTAHSKVNILNGHSKFQWLRFPIVHLRWLLATHRD